MTELSHLNEDGAARMVAIDQKKITHRTATATGALSTQRETLNLIREGRTPKGDVFATARIAGIMAAKETSRLIPLCHPLKLTSIDLDIQINEEQAVIQVEATVQALDRTGVEMEALTAVNISLLTLYDMLKAVDQTMVIREVFLKHKQGGKHDFSREPVSSSTKASVSAALGRSIRVIGKHPTPIEDTEEVTVAQFDSVDVEDESEDEALLSSCARPMLQLLTPPEPSSINQKENTEESSVEDGLTDQSVWEESVLADIEEPLPYADVPSLPEEALALALQVREVSMAYPPLKRFLTNRPVECAYLLGYLSPEASKRSRAYILEEEELTIGPDGASHLKIKALVFVYSGLTLPTVWTYGSELEVKSILHAIHHDLPRRIYLNMDEHHVQAVRIRYSLRQRRDILRMGLYREQYTPTGNTEGVVSLGHKDTGAIMGLFQRYYPDNLFEPAQLDLGLYCGIKGEEGELLSVAGIHLLNPDYRVAAIGNIVTDEHHRGRGYASQCVQHILDRLFEGVDHVALNVLEDNVPAIQCYEKFGFRTISRLVESQARLR